jgi:hypothetical protein
MLADYFSCQIAFNGTEIFATCYWQVWSTFVPLRDLANSLASAGKVTRIRRQSGARTRLADAPEPQAWLPTRRTLERSDLRFAYAIVLV